MYIADELLPDIMMSLCKKFESIEYKAPGLIMKLGSKRRKKKLLILIICPHIIRGVDPPISNQLTGIVLLIHAGRAIPRIDFVLSTYFFT
jgi:hypothetical protein